MNPARFLLLVLLFDVREVRPLGNKHKPGETHFGSNNALVGKNSSRNETADFPRKSAFLSPCFAFGFLLGFGAILGGVAALPSLRAALQSTRLTEQRARAPRRHPLRSEQWSLRQ